MFKVIINDFQSIQEAKFKVDGVTLIVGESNEGKSACLRALQAACTNRFKAGQVRHGQDHATIKIKTEESDDVLTVVRSWAGGSPKMKLGVQVFDKLNRTFPKEVKEFLNLGQIDLNGEVYSCNFHTQFQKPMLLEYSQQRVMEILSASTALDDLKETKEYVLAERTKNKGAISAVESMVGTTRQKLEALQGRLAQLQPIYEEYDAVHTNYEAVTEMLNKLEELSRLSELLTQVDKKKSVLEQIVSEFSGYEEVKEQLSQVDELVCCFTEVNNINKKGRLLTAYVNTYDEDLESRLEKVTHLKALIESEEVLSKKESKLQLKESKLEEITRLDDIVKSNNSKRMIAEQLESSLMNYGVILSHEANLVQVVEEHKCPICGNIVKE